MKNFSSLSSPLISNRFGSLYSELDITRKSALIFNVIFVVRRLVFAATAVCMSEAPYL